MESLRHHWKRVPNHIRKSIVLVVGLLFVIAAPFTGVLPGPGGIPVFLVGIAILATEFEWAERLRDYTIEKIKIAGRWYRQHKLIGVLVTIVAVLAIGGLSYLSFQRLNG
jgi:uncharacterized protein (TIGR02611 family)